MVEVQTPLSMPSTVASNHHMSAGYLPSLGNIARVRKDVFARSSTQLDLEERRSILPPLSYRGLQTPPGETTGMSLNPLVAPQYEALRYKSVPALRSTVAPQQSSVSTIPNSRYAGNPAASAGHYRRESQPEAQNSIPEAIAAQEHNSGREQARQTESTDLSSIVSYLQIPASINDSKGSLAEFAAQVMPLICLLRQGN